MTLSLERRYLALLEAAVLGVKVLDEMEAAMSKHGRTLAGDLGLLHEKLKDAIARHNENTHANETVNADLMWAEAARAFPQAPEGAQ
jgi:hypothetical protein